MLGGTHAGERVAREADRKSGIYGTPSVLEGETHTPEMEGLRKIIRVAWDDNQEKTENPRHTQVDGIQRG